MAARAKKQAAVSSHELHWQGDLTVRRIAVLKEELQAGLEGYQRLTLRLSEVTEVDLAFLQLLCAAHRFASRSRKELTIAADSAGVFAATQELAGFSRHVGCVHDSDGSCLWKRPIG